MRFVKLDVGILDSSLWADLSACRVFETALLMAEPFELLEATPQLAVRSLEPTGFTVPAGWYGKVEASGVGIVRRAHLPPEDGLSALERLGAPDADSRSPEFEGRRLVRTAGGYLVLNYERYRERDYSSAERSRRWRAKNKKKRA